LNDPEWLFAVTELFHDHANGALESAWRGRSLGNRDR